jgi:GT2 family glycosyltransferase
MDEPVKTAVIIPVFGRHDLTRATLRDLESEMNLADIWLVDNQGGFESEQIPVTILTPGSNLGWCRGCNYGVTSVWDYGYDVFILLNNDVRLSRYWRNYSWGCDKDFALRVRTAGGSVWVTERSFLNHMARQTAKQFQNYSELDAERENDKDMAEKWGPDWRDLLYAGFENLSRLGMVQQRIQE